MVVLEEIRRSEDTPGHVLGDLAFHACYPTHPYGLPILGPAQNVAHFNREQIRRFFERWYTPDNLFVVAVGDFDSQEVSEEIERLFGDARRGSARRERPAAPAPRELNVVMQRRSFEGHRIDLSWPAAPFRDKDATYLDLLAYVLGECESSRLVRRIREDEALVDRIDAGAYTPLDRGLFSVGFETGGDRLLQATRRVVEETERLRCEPVSTAELERARINFLASEQFARESVSGLTSKLGGFETIAKRSRTSRAEGLSPWPWTSLPANRSTGSSPLRPANWGVLRRDLQDLILQLRPISLSSFPLALL